MIQRIQSVFLLITAMAMAVFLGTNAYTRTLSESETISVNAYHVLHKVGGLGTEKPIYYVAVMGAIAVLVSLVAIFQYKNRIRQILFVAFNALMMGATLAVTVYHIMKDAKEVGTGGTESYEVGIFAIIVAMISNTLANYFIKKDEKLVRSADRMR
ncbi:DUF4293 domain-containing protein [Leadbetterella byssophila]|jgi:hypothetical protein|uniref:DUF4293 family protein n=1 Tax=Leadbetterella byssophila (strain DSM 17132 / JCM 16389 / KACC 11308 / NBRC 106382 / 4M15) TaxID=649349 RepID=E4RVS6_LEAB4|nr:DUF4293 domain-containing protein [Leadbetterella byssophila]ADQ17974.1 hypothetical protein Lbys_2297 [Leadbetterella byssophila DSM 17132]